MSSSTVSAARSVTAPVDEAQAERHRHQGGGQRGGEVEHGARQKGDAQRLHGGAAVLLADRGDALGLGLAAVEGAQGGQAAHDVEEVVREAREGPPAGPRAALGVAPDQPHEERDQGQRHAP